MSKALNVIWQYLRAFVLIYACLYAGIFLASLLPITIPGSIIGMGLLFAALQAGWVKKAWLEQLVNVLMTNLSLFLVPACVAVISYLDLIRKDWLSITVATLASTFLVLFVTGKAHELMRRYW